MPKYAWILIVASVQLLRPSDVNSSAFDSREPASSPSCKVSTMDIAVPTSANDIQAIMTRYGSRPECTPLLHSALESIFIGEERAEGWAGPLERKVKDATAAVHGAKIAGGCHTSLCRYDIELTPSVESAGSPNQIDHLIIDATARTPFQVESIHFGSTFKYRSYFYSTVPVAAFVEPLRRRMEGGN